VELKGPNKLKTGESLDDQQPQNVLRQNFVVFRSSASPISLRPSWRAFAVVGF
jgi:hypothetical protein